MDSRRPSISVSSSANDERLSANYPPLVLLPTSSDGGPQVEGARLIVNVFMFEHNRLAPFAKTNGCR